MSGKLNLKIRQGGDFVKRFRWEVEPFLYRPILGISSAAPCVINCPEHGLLPDQKFVVQSAKGLVELNAKEPHVLTDWHRATVIDAGTIQLNRVNSSDFKPYTEGGNIKYRTVTDLTGYTAYMQIKTKKGGTLLYELSTVLGNLTIDDILQYVSIEIPDEVLAAFTWTKGVYDIVLTGPGGAPYVFLEGEVQLVID